MKTLLLLLLPFVMTSQVFRTDQSAVLHHYAGVGISSASALSAFQLLPEHTNFRELKSCAIGFGVGLLAGLGKEFVWDRAMNKGVFSKADIYDTAWGSLCGALYFRVGVDVRDRVQEDKMQRFNDSKLLVSN